MLPEVSEPDDDDDDDHDDERRAKAACTNAQGRRKHAGKR